MYRMSTLVGAVAGLGLVLFGAAPSAAKHSGGASLVVGGCAAGSYSTIQAAVNAAPSNAVITVCPGRYAEQVNVPAGLGNLVLQGQAGATIEFPASGETATGPNAADAVVAMSTSSGDSYQLNNFTVQGPWTDGTNGRHFGVYVVGSGTAQINRDTVTNIIDSVAANQSAYDGFGVSFGDSGLFDDGNEVSGNGTLSNSTVSNYQQFGVSVSVQGSSATVSGNSITGLPGGIPGTPFVGIVVGDGASASLQGNTISGQVNPTPDPHNDFTQGDGVFLGFAPAAVTMSDNALNGNDIGLEIDGASGVVERKDRMTNNNFDGIHIDAKDPFGNISANNTLFNDRSYGNGVYDCEDNTTGNGTAGTADNWLNVHGATMTPAGICK
jgi:hypothetical protein